MSTAEVWSHQEWSSQVGTAEGEIVQTGSDPRLSPASSRALEVRPARVRPEPAAFVGVWVDAFNARLFELAALTADWDSYGAPPIRAAAARAMFKALKDLDSSIRAEPTVLPTSDGGMICEWASGSLTVELIADADGDISVYYRDEPGGERAASPFTDHATIRCRQ